MRPKAKFQREIFQEWHSSLAKKTNITSFKKQRNIFTLYTAVARKKNDWLGC